MFFKQMLDKLTLVSYWISLPWVPPAIAVLLMAVCLCLFFRLRVNLRRLAKSLVTRLELETGMQCLRDELQQFSARLSECEAAPTDSAPAVWASRPVAVDLNSRGQILRLHRKGNSVHEIASGLHVSPGEVELMIKVHDISRCADSVSIPSSPL